MPPPESMRVSCSIPPAVLLSHGDGAAERFDGDVGAAAVDRILAPVAVAVLIAAIRPERQRKVRGAKFATERFEFERGAVRPGHPQRDVARKRFDAVLAAG